MMELLATDVYLLARVSTKEQGERGNSIPAQVKRLRNYIKEKTKLNLVEEYTFDESARKEDRKKFEEFLSKVTKSRKTIAICCDKVDRLLRDFPTWLPKLDKLRKKGLVELHFVSDHLIVHQNSPAIDLFQFNMAVALAQYFSDSISDNTCRGLEGKLQKGEWPSGNIPRGYKSIKEIVKDRLKIVDIVWHEDEYRIIQKIFALYARGLHSYDQLRDWSYEQGFKSKNGKKVSRRLMADLLQNPFYYGMMRFKGKRYPHKYSPLISKSLFDKVQAVIEQKRFNKRKSNVKCVKMFQGLITCKRCGCAITVEVKKQGRYVLYSCTNHYGNCERIYVNENHICKQIEDALEEIKLNQEGINWLTNQLRYLHEGHKRFQSHNIRVLEKEYRKVRQHIDSLVDKYTQPDSRISDQVYSEKLLDLQNQQGDIKEQITQLKENGFDYHITVKKIMEIAQNARNLFRSSEIEKKRRLLNLAFQNLQLDGKKLYFSMCFPLNEVVEAVNCHEMGRLRDTFRTEQFSSLSKELEALDI